MSEGKERGINSEKKSVCLEISLKYICTKKIIPLTYFFIIKSIIISLALLYIKMVVILLLLMSVIYSLR